MDGHTGIKNEKANEANSGPFRLVLSALEEDARSFTFIIHATTNWLSGPGIHPEELLGRIGYAPFRGRCPFHGDRCNWLLMASIARGADPGHWHTQNVHDSFKRHAELLPQLRTRYGEAIRLLQLPGSNRLDLFPELRRREIPILELTPGALPTWVVAEMPAKFHEMERKARELLDEYDRLKKVAGLLWDGNEPLMEAVFEVFHSSGFNVEKTEKGATWDITVELDHEKRLLVEVGGSEGVLKKNSSKISQALAASQQSGNQDRVVLALNLNREIPLRQRNSHEVVTREALELLTRLNAVIIQTAKLFEIWKASLDDPVKAKEALYNLHSVPAGIVF